MKYLVPALALVVALVAGCGSFTEEGWVFRTADPGLSILVPYAEAPLLPTVTPAVAPEADPEVVPEEEVGEIEPEPTLEPPSQDIKGNISSSGEKIYHLPDGAYYDQVKIDEASGEMWFRTEEEAQAAGWRKSSR